MKLLILEDNKYRIDKFKEIFKHQELYICDNVLSAFDACLCNEFSVMQIDHDLDNRVWVNSNEENTGYQFIKKLVDNKLQKNCLFYVHSSNPIGANKILNYLLDNNYDGIWLPWHIIVTLI